MAKIEQGYVRILVVTKKLRLALPHICGKEMAAQQGLLHFEIHSIILAPVCSITIHTKVCFGDAGSVKTNLILGEIVSHPPSW